MKVQNAALTFLAAIVLAALVLPAPAAAQDPEPAAPPAAQVQTRCEDAEPPNARPPAGSPTLFRCAEFRFHPVNEPIIPGETYLNHLPTRAPWSQPSSNHWVPYDEDQIQAYFWNLWNTGFLDDLWIEVIDEPYVDGTGGKHVIFHMEERSRVKQVDYVGSSRVSISAIEDAMSEQSIRINLDSFVDQTVIRRIRSLIRDLYSEKGYNEVDIATRLEELPGGPKLVRLVFDITEGPKYQIREVVFDGNEAFSDTKLRRQMVANKEKSLFSFLTSAGTYLEARFAEDAEAITQFYLNEGYVKALVGTPRVETIEDSEDGSERYVRLRIPVDEGQRYRIGRFDITGNNAVREEALIEQFKIKTGDWFDRETFDKGVEKLQEIYGQLGFYKMSPQPSFCFPAEQACPNPAEASASGDGQAAGAAAEPPPAQTPAAPAEQPAATPDGDPVVDVTLELIEGDMYFVNRITFQGNTTTHDSVIRREMRIAEGGAFNMQGLQESVRRLNQLGYFQPFEGRAEEVQIVDTPDKENMVDVTMRVVEQNRNQITFGAGVSQFDGFFGQLSYQTANFLGRGEVLGVSLQRGAYADNYQVSFSEPYLFDRPITIGMDVFKRTFQFPFQYSQDSVGGNLVLGLPATDYSRWFVGYSYQEIRVYDINEAFLDPNVLAFNPLLIDSLLLNVDGKRTVSKISPSWVFNTVNSPIFPTNGTRYTVASDFAGVGGNTSYVQGRLEAIWYKSLTRRMSFGARAQGRYIRPFGETTILPIFEKYFLGGEYDIRGFDLRTISPRDPSTGLITGGNKTIVLNAEYSFDIASPVRVLAFFDAGQVQNLGDPFRWNDPIEFIRTPGDVTPVLTDPFAFSTLRPIANQTRPPEVVNLGQRPAFKVSTGFELRFFMPVVNVPFRLIAAWNPSRAGILTNDGVLTPRFTFRFAVGSTF